MLYSDEIQDSLFTYLLPFCLTAWRDDLRGTHSGYGGFVEHFYLVLANKHIFDVHLTPAQTTAVSDFMHQSILEEIDDQRGLTYEGMGARPYRWRYVPLTARAAQELKAALEHSRYDHVFTTQNGRRSIGRHYPTHEFNLAATALNLPKDAVLHSTRHTFCTRLGEAGADAFTIQRLAGHSSITISQGYVHPTSTIMETAVTKMESVRNAQSKAAQQGQQ